MEQRKKRIKIIMIILGVLIAAGVVVWMVPFFKAIGVSKGRIYPYSYVVYGDHVELTRYLGKGGEVEIPSRIWGRPVTEIGYMCFEYWQKRARGDYLRKVTIPDSVKVIGTDAFRSCLYLEEVEGGKNVAIIKRGAFCACEGLKSVGDMGTNVEEIQQAAFVWCEKLTYFPITEKLKVLYPNAFYDSGIKRKDIVARLKELGGEAFQGTLWMEQTEEEFVVDGDSLIMYQGTGETAVIPEGIRWISTKEFEDNPNLREIYIPSTVDYIEQGIFRGCKNVRIYIPKEVREIGHRSGSSTVSDGGRDVGPGECGTIADLDSNVTIVTTAGSPAEAYAKEWGYDCEIVEGW